MEPTASETPTAPVTPKPRKRRWLPRPRYSLRTLLLGVLLFGAAGALWRNWEPWALERRLDGHKSEIRSLSFSSDSRLLLSGGWDHAARIWNVANETTCALLTGHTDCVNTSIFFPDGKYVATSSTDKTARVWDIRGTELWRIQGNEWDSVPWQFRPIAGC